MPQTVPFPVPDGPDTTINNLDYSPAYIGLGISNQEVYDEASDADLKVLINDGNFTRAIGAVNVIRITHKGKDTILKGFNSDVIGFTRSIEPLIKPHHKKALILGTGGASKAINYGLKSLGLETVFVSRYERPGTIQYQNITPEIIKEYNVIVNCTPCGMYPNVDECPDIPYDALNDKCLLYDLLYNPDETLFMKKGAAKGAVVKNGLEMLLLQAFASWEFWNGKEQE